LVPGEPVLDLIDVDVSVTGVYQGRRRMTLTYPIINRARRILWLVTGNEKVGALLRLREADPSIPAGRILQDRAVIFSDRTAAGDLASQPAIRGRNRTSEATSIATTDWHLTNSCRSSDARVFFHLLELSLQNLTH